MYLCYLWYVDMIPKYDASGPQFDQEDVLDVIPEQEKQEQIISASEDAYLNSLERASADKIKNTEKMWGGLTDLSSSIADLVQKKIDKHKEDREAQIKLDILTRYIWESSNGCLHFLPPA